VLKLQEKNNPSDHPIMNAFCIPAKKKNAFCIGFVKLSWVWSCFPSLCWRKNS
jgi:hypothetical protein